MCLLKPRVRSITAIRDKWWRIASSSSSKHSKTGSQLHWSFLQPSQLHFCVLSLISTYPHGCCQLTCLIGGRSMQPHSRQWGMWYTVTCKAFLYRTVLYHIVILYLVSLSHHVNHFIKCCILLSPPVYICKWGVSHITWKDYDNLLYELLKMVQQHHHIHCERPSLLSKVSIFKTAMKQFRTVLFDLSSWQVDFVVGMQIIWQVSLSARCRTVPRRTAQRPVWTPLATFLMQKAYQFIQVSAYSIFYVLSALTDRGDYWSDHRKNSQLDIDPATGTIAIRLFIRLI